MKHARLKGPSVKGNYVNPLSRKSIKLLSPASKKIHMNKARLERKAMIKSLKHYRKHDVVLNDDQNDELLQLVSKVSDVGKDTLEKVLGEADAMGKGNVL